MSTNFQCEYCNHYYASRNAYAQHVGRCIKIVICSSTEESGENVSSMVSSVNEMLLDNEDFSHIDEFQIIQKENLPGRSSNMEECENFDEILPASLRSCENFNEILPASLRSCENILSASLRSYNEPEEEPEVESIREFPNEAYADLMTLVIENNLSNKAGNAIIKFFNKYSDLPQSSPLPKNIETGRKFMNKMNISQLSYSKYCILIHNGQEYFIHYRPIKNYATTTDTLGKNSLHPIYLSLGNIPTWRRNKEDAKQLLGYFLILSAKNKTEKESFDFKKLVRKTFHDSIKFLLDPLFQGDGGVDFNIDGKDVWFFPRISTIIYATTTDTLGKNSLHPIYLSLGNIPTWRRNKEDAKQLLGYFLILSAKNKTEKESSDFKKLARKTFHDSIKFLLDPLFQGDGGVDFNIDGKDVWFFPRISTIICDWPEACTFSLTYKSANSNYPCHFCLVQKEDLIDIRKDQLILRDHVNMKEYFNNGTSNSAGLEQVDNYFWNIPNLNIYTATVPDRMHHLDLGLFKYQIEFTTELLKLKPGKLVDDINKRIAKIPRHSGLKLHSWIYHIVDTIREHRAINGYTTETYESLHKTYVKIPYRLSNKKDIRCRAIVMQNCVKKTKTPVAFTYTAKLFDFNFSEAIINEHRDNPKLNKNMSKVDNFHDRPWFSNIAINMDIEELSDYQTDNGICYAQTLLITEIRLPNKSTPLHLALVQWYDFKSEITPFVYGCPLLELVELYNFIEIEAIEDIVHVISRFDKTNEHFVMELDQ
ncbi:hypothetical protein Glove_145g8 [Diversispora epigaea]|uniref:DOD-type homing endonuclease domain-containing protein n=1 Tax=Diversispora epigaea TaxID=1348612 RepID=A0A397J0A7_9GLOM|nr:hypothetical protein Glove_145g8 [Diversispora epigaea]